VLEDDGQYNNTIMMRILGPVVRFVDRPWKMYPVGVLFGFGFDTASSIALLAVSALAKKGTGTEGVPPADVVILPLLFTAGMTLLDSIDSILMLYSYTGFPERRFRIFEPVEVNGASEERGSADQEAAALPKRLIWTTEIQASAVSLQVWILHRHRSPNRVAFPNKTKRGRSRSLWKMQVKI